MDHSVYLYFILQTYPHHFMEGQYLQVFDSTYIIGRYTNRYMT